MNRKMLSARAVSVVRRVGTAGAAGIVAGAIVATAIVATGIAVSCSGSGGTPDKELPGLVTATASGDEKVDAARAGKDAAVAARAVALPHHVLAAMGNRKVVAHSKVEVREGSRVVETLTTDTTIEIAASGELHAISNNSGDYGREVFFVGGALYLRPRYGRWHKRAPGDDGETRRIVDEMASELAAHYELVARGVDVSDGGATQTAGRPAHKVTFKLSSSPKKPVPQTVTQRKWREGMVPEAAAGDLVLDDATGAPLEGHLTAQVAFSRDGRRFTLVIEASHAVTALPAAPTFALPPGDEVVATPERLREVDDRDFLLEGLAPPTRRNRETP